jgi:hypothetical protein
MQELLREALLMIESKTAHKDEVADPKAKGAKGAKSPA